jgi:hypothetical protein
VKRLIIGNAQLSSRPWRHIAAVWRLPTVRLVGLG